MIMCSMNTNASINACKAKKPDCIVKVIIETPHLKAREELAKACELVIASGADYVKQATGYATGNFGYTDEVVNADVNVGTDCVRAIHEIVGNRIKIKNAGCPRDLDECLYYIKEFGCISHRPQSYPRMAGSRRRSILG